MITPAIQQQLANAELANLRAQRNQAMDQIAQLSAGMAVMDAKLKQQETEIGKLKAELGKMQAEFGNAQAEFGNAQTISETAIEHADLARAA